MIRNVEGSPPHSVETLDANQATNTFRIAWQRKSLVILSLVIALVLGSFYYAQAPRVYRSEAGVLVLKKRPEMMAFGSEAATTYLEDYLVTHTILLRSPMMINKAISRNDRIKSLKSFQNMDQSQIMNTIQGDLDVKRNTGEGSTRSSVLTMSFRCSEPTDSSQVLMSIFEAYQDYLEETYNKVSGEMYDQFKNASDILNRQMRELDEKHREFRKRYPFVASRTRDGLNARIMELQQVQNELLSKRRQYKELEIGLATIQMALKSDKPQAALLLLAMEITRMTGDNMRQNSALAIQDKIMELEIAKQEMLTQYGPNHPYVQNLDKRMQFYKDYGQKTQKPLVNPLKPDGVDNPNQKVDLNAQSEENPLLNGLRAQELELNKLGNVVRFWEEQLAIVQERAKTEVPLELEEEEIVRNKENLQKLYNTAIDLMNRFNLSKDTGGFKADLIAPPSLGVQVEPKAFTVFAIAIFLGLAMGFGLAYLADITDKSFRSPEEIRRRLNLPVLGHIPALLSEEEEKAKSEGVAGPDPILCTYYKPKSRKAEVFRAVRTALYFNTRGEGHKVIQITSPNMGDGKTTLSTNLAVSIAQSGKRIVLIDADFRRPRINKVFGLSNDIGFTTVLTGQCELREAIQQTMIPGLMLLTCGPIPPNPAELLTSLRFKELIDELREQFDFVLIDTPPLLVVTDPCVVAPRVDGVLLTIRVAKNGRPVAERARDVLNSLGANVLGVVVNGINLYTGSYGYGYGYNYGYQYGNYDYGSYQYKYDYYDRYYAPYGDDYYHEGDEGKKRSTSTNGGPATALAPPETQAPSPPEKPGEGGFFNRLFGKK